MKNLKLCLTGIAVLFALIIYSCSTEVNDTEPHVSQQTTNLRNAELNYGLKLPDQTQFTFEDESITFTLPDGYSLIGYDINEQYRSSSVGKLTCTCETAGSTGACTPTETKKTVGCNTEKSNPCPECKGKISAATPTNGYELAQYYIMTPSDNSTTYSLFSDIRAAIDLDEWSNLSWLDVSEIEETELLEMLDFAWEDYPPTEPSVDILMISESGKFRMEIPFASLEAGNIYTSVGKTTCSGCEGKCKLKKAALGKVRYCDGCNSGCTISW